MTNLLILSAIASLGGIAVTIQALFMGVMDKKIGTFESVFITYGAGGLIIGIVMLIKRGGNLNLWHTVPWYNLSAGILGLVIVGSIGFTAPLLGTLSTLAVIIATQIAAGALIDHYGLLGATYRLLDLTKVVGIGFLFFGAWLIVKK